MKLRAIMIVLLALTLFVNIVSASGVTTDRLNFYNSEQHTINISNTVASIGSSASTMPAGFSFVSSVSGCTNPGGQNVVCSSISANSNAYYIITSTSSGNEYELYNLNTTLNGTQLNNVSFINIKEDEIFHTLVEYGRGRGNYFFDSMGTATSAGTGTGYRYVPNGTDFELNYLHKVYNIKQYFNLASSEATDVTFTCDYPVHTVVRQHLTQAITKGGSEWTVSYSLPKIEGSWERMGFLGMDIDSGEYSVGDNFTINCTNLDYNLGDAYGHIVIDEDSFYLQVRDPNPLSVISSSVPTTIGNGTSEVAIAYTITNNEVYPLDEVTIEIDAPELAQFIGVRGELWGSARDKYSYELTNMDPGQSETLVLIARFDTSSSADTSIELSQGIKAKFTPTWEINAYNPSEYLQLLTITDTLTVNYGLSSSIVSIQTQLSVINTTTYNIQNTVAQINTTVNNINNLLSTINSTVNNIELTNQQILVSINDSRDAILNAINTSQDTIIANLTATIEANMVNFTFDSTEILNELSYMQSFNEELIFLVTDSVGLQKESKKSFESGDTTKAIEQLTEAADKLNKANEIMSDIQKPLQHEQKIAMETNPFKKIWYKIEGLFM